MRGVDSLTIGTTAGVQKFPHVLVFTNRKKILVDIVHLFPQPFGTGGTSLLITRAIEGRYSTEFSVPLDQFEMSMELSTDSGIKIDSCRVIVEFGSQPGIPAVSISRRRYIGSVKLLLPVTAGNSGENDVER